MSTPKFTLRPTKIVSFEFGILSNLQNHKIQIVIYIYFDFLNNNFVLAILSKKFSVLPLNFSDI